MIRFARRGAAMLAACVIGLIAGMTMGPPQSAQARAPDFVAPSNTATVSFTAIVRSVGSVAAPDGPAHLEVQAADSTHKGFAANADIVRLAVAEPLGFSAGDTVTVTVTK